MNSLQWLSQYLLVAAIPYFLLLMLWEWLALRRPRLAQRRGYVWRDTAVSITMGLIKLGMLALCAGFTAAAFAWVYEHRVFTLSPLVWWSWVLLFFADDFAYYWYHRSAHRIRIFWAEHVNHHSSEYYNLGTALRQSALGPAYVFIFWLPLAWLGFHPLAIAVQMAVSLLYQFWIHTEAIGRLGWFEQIFNTPSHHRVHHGSNGIYLDRNYAGILIIWDRLFGSFQAERDDVPVRYGLVHNVGSYFLPRVIFHELLHALRGAWRAPRWRDKLLWIFGPPEWSPQGPRWPVDHPRYRPPATAAGTTAMPSPPADA